MPEATNQPEPGSPADWLRYAGSDLALARLDRVGAVMTEMLCFHAQQAAEKALKAVLVHLGHQVPYTHDLAQLVTRLQADLEVPPAVTASTRLSDYVVLTRYPADIAPVDEDEYHEAVRQAEAVFAWATSVVHEPKDRAGRGPG